MEIKLWMDENKQKIDPNLFSEKADKFAAEIFDGQIRTRGKANKPTQLRKFYEEVLRFDAMLKELPKEEQKAKFEALLPYLKMLNAKTAYAMARDLVTKEFKDFITNSLKQINDISDFRIFVNFFEAFMGFYRYYDEKKQPERERGGRQ